jgi:transcriptional regulator with XRE-family HTH domain
MTEDHLDFSILKTAGLSQGDFALLSGVTRVTVNLWVNGKPPSRFLREKLADLLAAGEKAHFQGATPSPRKRRSSDEKRLNELKLYLSLAN